MVVGGCGWCVGVLLGVCYIKWEKGSTYGFSISGLALCVLIGFLE